MATIAVRVDEELKKEATELFNSLGFDMSTAVKMFLIQSVNTGSIPFEIKREINDKNFQKVIDGKLPSIES